MSALWLPLGSMMTFICPNVAVVNELMKPLIRCIPAILGHKKAQGEYGISEGFNTGACQSHGIKAYRVTLVNQLCVERGKLLALSEFCSHTVWPDKTSIVWSWEREDIQFNWPDR
ncbi:hypothetical protein F5146DRAFT_1144816 [Armillaria mellea]|nr:hypothetical protein F5146DRAFT_1144816 [Armillaria mellea]